MDDFPGQMLHQACIYNNHDLLADLLRGEERDNINALDAAGRSVVYSAVSNNAIDCLSVLLNQGADPNVRCERFNDQTPLHQAALDGKDHIVRLLLEFNADFMLKDRTNKTPLDLAKTMSQRCANILKDAQDTQDGLLSQELSTQLQNIEETNLERCERLAEILDRSKVEDIVNTKLRPDRVTLLYRACILRRADLVKWLIEHGAKAEYDTASNQTPLYAACHSESVDAAQTLLEKFPHFIDIATSETVGKVHCLHLACQTSLQMLRVLMEFQYPDDLMEYHFTPNRKYAYRSAFNVNVTTLVEWSPLYFATAAQKPEIVKYLLQYETMGYPLSSMFAELPDREVHHVQIEDYIDEDRSPHMIHPVDVGQKAVDSTAPLHHAVKNCFMSVVELLVKHQADINQVCDLQESTVRGEQNYSPMKFAIKLAMSLIDPPEEQKRDKITLDRVLDMISFMLRNGVRDENGDILFSCFLGNYHQLVKFLLKHKAHADNQRKLPHHASSAVNAGHTRNQDEVDSHIVVEQPVAINWHHLHFPNGVSEEWISECSMFINPSLSRETSLNTITSLDISNSGLLSLPPCVITLTQLVHLNLQNNKLYDLPAGITWNLPSLREVNLDHNRFKFVPESLFSIPSLEKLMMNNNRIETVSFNMWTAPKLVDLMLAHNHLTELPSSPPGDALTNGHLAEARRQRRSESTDSIHLDPPKTTPTAKASPQTSLKSSATVVRKWTDSVDVVDELEAPSNATLTTLILSNNKLKSVPQGLACLAPKLHKLDLSHNQITSMGLPSNYPMMLANLNLSYNKLQKMDITELGDGCMYSGKYCYSPSRREQRHARTPSGGDITIPRNRNSAGSRSSLMSMASTSSSGWCKHRTSPRFDSLENLNLSNNQITELIFTASDQAEPVDPDRTRSVSDSLALPKLNTMDLSNNKLTELPAVISEHSKLNQLYLSKNRLRDLPPEMGLLKDLWILDLAGCPLEGPLAEKVERKALTGEIIGFLKSVLKDSKLYASMKLMIVGQANIGKTSLLAELRKEGKAFQPFKTFSDRVNNAKVVNERRNGETISTVGVDIGDLTFEKMKSNRGKVTFKTWDFGGQEEYYATHQYFLSKRSLYLVLYKLTDGVKAMDNIKQWLINIQTRSPGAPVLIVGTHFDVFKSYKRSKSAKGWERELRDLRALMESSFKVADAATAGLPNVIDFIEVSTKTQYKIEELANKIYNTAWDLKAPGSHTMALLEQKIPAIYIQLESVVGRLADKRKAERKDPVLKTAEYRALVCEEITFRDMDELDQATQFLHDNGVLLHYQDSALSDLYFLDPQWLCDMLAHVITINPVNMFVKNGIMEIASLGKLFSRSAIFQADDVQNYIITLMSKFELALMWSTDSLLIPSLLPTETDRYGTEAPVKIPMCKPSSLRRKLTMKSVKSLKHKRTREHSNIDTTESASTPNHVQEGQSTFYYEVESPPPSLANSVELGASAENSYISSRAHESIRRVYLLAYIPSGFWPRLISRIYRDDTICVLTEFLFDVPEEHAGRLRNREIRTWQCWKTGLALSYMTSDLLKVKQVDKSNKDEILPYYQTGLVINGEPHPTDVSNMYILEIEITDNTIEISQPGGEKVESYDACKEIRAQLLAKVVDHIETLLKDWYPDLGDNFQQNSRGDYLVRRLVPCPSCFEKWHNYARRHLSFNQASSGDDSDSTVGNQPPPLLDEEIDADHFEVVSCDLSLPIQSLSSIAGSVSGTVPIVGGGGVTAPSSVLGSEDQGGSRKQSVGSQPCITCYPVEDLLVSVFSTHHHDIQCQNEHRLQLEKYTPDLVFIDQNCTMSLRDVTLDQALGLGAFGVVFKGQLTRSSHHVRGAVAVKTMQPYNPGNNVPDKYRAQFEAGERSWKQDPQRQAFTSYSDARQEINILNLIQHAHIVSLVGVLLQPLSIVMECAPRGSLQDTIDEYSRDGVKIPLTVLQLIIKQVSSAISYLHNESTLIYRDLKADNVLVWAMPAPMRRQQATDQKVEVRIADFGVSSVSDRTARGNWGTPGYMAPEIILFGGKEDYDEKVDCFSFGSFMYELMTLNRPFHNADGNVNNLVMAGKRPAITNKEVSYPTNMLDLMSMCWRAEAKDRPSAEQILEIASDPIFIRLQEPVRCEAPIEYVTHSCAYTKTVALDMSASFLDVSFDARGPAGYDIYMVGGAKADRDWSGRVEKLTYGSHGQFVSAQSCELEIGAPLIQSCCAVGQTDCWLGDVEGYITIIRTDAEGALSVRGRFLAAPPYLNTHSPTSAHPSELPSPGSQPVCGRIRHMLYAKGSHRVYCLLSKGTLIEYDAETGDKLSTRCISTHRDCSCMLLVNDSLWIGQRDAYISIIPLLNQEEDSQSVSDWMSSDECYTCTVNHFNPVEQFIDTAYLVTDADGLSVWSNLYPGSSIHHWDVKAEKIVNQVNISTTIADSTKSPDKKSYQLADLAYHQSQLIVGSTCGTVILLDSATLDLIIHLSPHAMADYRALYSVVPLPNSQKFLTIGVGYRNSISDHERRSDGAKKPPIHILSWYNNPALSF